MERYTLGCALQGGGLYISGTATLTNTNVYSNEANRVCSPCSCPVISSITPMERYVLGFCLQGGGLDIQGTAMLTKSNVYSNIADRERARLLNLQRRFIHYLTSPRWNVMRSAF